MTRIDYSFVNGDFTRIAFTKLPKAVATKLNTLARQEERLLCKESGFIVKDGYEEGMTEQLSHNICCSSHVEDEVEKQELINLIREVMSTLSPALQRRIWLYAQGYTKTEIAQIEGVSEAAIRKAIKTSKVKIKSILQKEFGFGQNMWG